MSDDQLYSMHVSGGLTAEQIEFLVDHVEDCIENKIAHGGNPAWLHEINAALHALAACELVVRPISGDRPPHFETPQEESGD
jgi:hypothetical protein